MASVDLASVGMASVGMTSVDMTNVGRDERWAWRAQAGRTWGTHSVSTELKFRRGGGAGEVRWVTAADPRCRQYSESWLEPRQIPACQENQMGWYSTPWQFVSYGSMLRSLSSVLILGAMVGSTTGTGAVEPEHRDRPSCQTIGNQAVNLVYRLDRLPVLPRYQYGGSYQHGGGSYFVDPAARGCGIASHNKRWT
jgi:hypothetical protein